MRGCLGLLDELGQTPEGQKLVRVGTDILLISVGTGMVLDAIKIWTTFLTSL